MTPCNSSLIHSYEYDEKAELLTLVFATNGDIRHYSPIPVEMFWDFESAKSKGSFYNQKIKGHPEFNGTLVGKLVLPEVVPPPAMDPEVVAGESPFVQLTGRGFRVTESADVGAGGLRITEVPETQPEIMSPDQAVAVISPKNPKADELTTRLHAMAAATKGIAVKDAATQRQMEEHLVNMTTVRQVLFAIIDPYRAIAYAAYEQIQKLNKSRLDPVDAALKDGKLAVNTYVEAERRKAWAEQQRQQAIADEESEKERRRRTEELRLSIAQEAQETGDMAAAEAILSDETIQAAPVQVYAPRIEMPSSSLPGRKNWRAEVLDKDALILDVAAGIESLKKTGKLNGHAPSSTLDANLPALNKRAKADETEALFPGVRAWNDAVLSTTKMKK